MGNVSIIAIRTTKGPIPGEGWGHRRSESAVFVSCGGCVWWLCVVVVCVVIVIFASLPLEALIKLKWDQITSGAILDCY